MSRSKHLILHLIFIWILHPWCATGLRLAVAATAAQAGVRPGDDIDGEFDYAADLIEMGLPEYAEMVVDKVIRAHPDQEDRANVIRAQALISLQQFKQVEEIVTKMPRNSPKAQAIKLALADGYYQAGDEQRCRSLYQEFFNQYTNRIPTDSVLLRFYQEAAHKFAQMLARKNDPNGAAQIYDLLLAAMTDREMMRQIRMEQAEMLLKAAIDAPEAKELNTLLTKVETNCNEVIWGGMDLWFGRAVSCLAQIEVARGRKDEAAKLLRTNLPVLKKLDDLLRETNIPISESPFAGARLLLGKLYHEEADLFMGTKEERESEALRCFMGAFVEFEAVWELMVKVNKRDASLEKRKDKATAVLSGTTSQRQQPFVDIAAALKQFEDTLAQYTGDKGWTPAVTERANGLKGKLHTLLTTVNEYPKEIGVTPSAELMIGDDFKGREHIECGLSFLADEESRQKKGTELYAKALQEFYNVFIGYPGSEWGIAAGEKVTLLKDRLKDLTGKNVTIEVKKGGRKKLGLVMLSEGNDLFSRKEYGKAVETYLKGLNEYPEGDESIVALANLLECYAQMKDVVRVKMVALYLSERFAERSEAAPSLLRLGRYYYKENNKEMYSYIYELYLSHFPDHQTAPTILYMLGEQRWKVNDYAGAVPYYERVVQRYARSSFFLKALSRIGWSYYLGGNYQKAVEIFSSYLAEDSAGEAKAQVKLCLADSYRQLNDYAKALHHYRELEEWLSEKVSVYPESETAIAKRHEILEQAVFFQAYCLSRMSKPEDKAPAYHNDAIDRYRKFVERFPDSPLAPTALSSLGALLLSEGKSGEASKTYEELAIRYPKSDAGQNARFAMIRSLLDIGQKEKAKKVLDEMVAKKESFPPGHFLKVGQLMLEEADNESAECAFSVVVESLKKSPDTSKERLDMEQRALFGLGKAQVARGHFEEAARNIDELITRYPTSGLFYEARFLLGRAYKEIGKTDEAVEALRDVFRRAADQNLLNRATMELARIQLVQGNVADALASCQRIVLLGNVDDPATREIYEEALIHSVRILVDMGKWRETIQSCDQYIANFPSGKGIVEARKWRVKAVTQMTLEKAERSE